MDAVTTNSAEPDSSGWFTPRKPVRPEQPGAEPPAQAPGQTPTPGQGPGQAPGQTRIPIRPVGSST
ncbi:MAG: hypothetical protein QOF44_3577, partial [Streptomyces sp.]|nr:hypothetical protein [Streptomyces sp.]